jgi:hypothetical protein
MIGPPEVQFSSIFTQLPTALFCKITTSHTATAQEGRAEPARMKGDSASHRMRKGRRVGSKMQNEEREGFNRRGRYDRRGDSSSTPSLSSQ